MTYSNKQQSKNLVATLFSVNLKKHLETRQKNIELNQAAIERLQLVTTASHTRYKEELLRLKHLLSNN